MSTRDDFSAWFNGVFGDPGQGGQEIQGVQEIHENAESGVDRGEEEKTVIQAIEAAKQAIEEAKQNPGPKTELAAQLAIEAAEKALNAVPRKPAYPVVPDGGELPYIPHVQTTQESFQEWLPQVLPPWR